MDNLKLRHDDGAQGKVRGSKLLQFSVKSMLWMSDLNGMVIHPIID